MKRILVVIVLLLQVQLVHGQSNTDSLIQRALILYSEGRYNDIIELLDDSSDSRAILFVSKSHFSLGNYSEAGILSRSLLADTNPIIKSEAQLILSMSLYHQKDYSGALNTIDLLLTDSDSLPKLIVNQASELRKELMDSFSFRQRLTVVSKIRSEMTRSSLVTDYFERYPKEIASQLLFQLSKYDSDFKPETIQNLVMGISEGPILPTTPSYVKGSILNLGILLPSFEDDASNRGVSRGIYNGVLVAVDEYNRTHSDRKVQIHFIETEVLSRKSLDQLSKDLENLGIDMIIGPLFSNHVQDIGALARKLGIPAFAPLANTFERTEYMNHVFQLNPTFGSRGASTARIAFEKLNLRKVGVMAELNTQGEIDAKAFVERFTEYGGEVPYNFIENFAQMGYFVGDQTPWFASNQALVDSTEFVVDTLDAVYFPFTGDVAGTLLNLSLTGLEAYSPDYLILGNEEMAYIDHSTERLAKLNLLYTGTSYLDPSSIEIQNFSFDYLNRSGIEPNTFSYLGYDLAKYYLLAVDKIGNPDDFMIFVSALDPFNGISNSIHFSSDKNNQALNLFKITSDGTELIEFEN